jgi:SSS family solute:Na+ symporter
VEPIVLGIVGCYLLGMLGIGWWSSQRIVSNDDFMVAGRRLGPWLLAGSLAATEVGGGSSLGVSEKAFGEWGLSAVWYVLAMAVTFGALAFVAPRLRLTGVRTVPEYFRQRYGRGNGLLTAILLILPMIGLTAVQLIASATVFSVMTGVGYTTSVVVVTVVVTLYSVMGGLWSVAITDVVQWVFIVIGSALVIPFALSKAGGVEAVTSVLSTEQMSLTAGIGWKTIVSLCVMYFASFAVGQESMQRFFAARDGSAARRGALLAAGAYLVYAFIPALIGLLAFSLLKLGHLDGSALDGGNLRYVLPVMASQVLPPVVTGLLFAGLISATMSSADSNLLAAGSIFSNDIYRVHMRPDASDAQVLKTTRVVMIVVAVLGLLVALLDVKDIVSLLMFSFTLRAGGIFIPYVLGHYWPEATARASVAAVVVGSLVVVLAEQGFVPTFGFEAVLPGIAASALAFWVLGGRPQESAPTD